MKLKDLLAGKPRAWHTIAHDLTVRDAARLMIRENAPALVVLKGEEPVGLLTVGDILRLLVNPDGPSPGNTRVGDMAAGDCAAAEAHEEIVDRLATMLRTDTEWACVVEGGRFIGVLGLKELMRYQIDALGAEVETLRDYASCLQEAMRD
jgi:CBS domain-containing protein